MEGESELVVEGGVSYRTKKDVSLSLALLL